MQCLVVTRFLYLFVCADASDTFNYLEIAPKEVPRSWLNCLDFSWSIKPVQKGTAFKYGPFTAAGALQKLLIILFVNPKLLNIITLISVICQSII